MEFILLLIAIVIIFVMVKFLFKLGKSVSIIILGIGVIVLFGGQVLIAYILERLAKLISTRFILSLILTFAIIFLTIDLIANGIDGIYESYSFGTFKIGFSTLLFSIVAYLSYMFETLKEQSVPTEVLEKKEDLFYLLTFTAFGLNLSSIYTYLLFDYFSLEYSYLVYAESVFYASSILVQLAIFTIFMDIHNIFKKIKSELYVEEAIKSSQLCNLSSIDIFMLEEDEREILARGFIAKFILDDKFVEININNDSWIIKKELYDKVYTSIIKYLETKIQLSENELISIIKECLPIDYISDITYYIENYLNEVGEYYIDRYGVKYFALYKKENYQICSSCGVIEYVDEKIDDEWFCSDICENTEEECLVIKDKPFDKFVEDSSTSGFILMQGATKHNILHKLTSPDSTTNVGYGAEYGNDMADKLSLKDAKIVGGDNAKNGADRLVNGTPIQSKYLKTAQRSVNAAFDNKSDGMLKYINQDGTPMQIEVPKDQYDKAVEAMAKKIKEGKVKGITDPKEASKIIRKGNLTYQQAKNITKFGTFESITFDMVNGAVISFSASGISFGITFVIQYLNIKDKKEAIQIATLQAGKTFATTMVVYVGSQQLHRLKLINDMLKNININHFPKSLQKVLETGLGASSKSAATKMIRGSAVTSVVLVAVTSGPDFIKMLRGRVSGAQFLQNLATVSSGVAGGGVGSVIGGVLGSPLGPIGIIGGQFIGGIAGGMATSFVANKFIGKLRKSDQEKMMEIINIQFVVLIKMFMITQEEIENIEKNLSISLNQKVLETMYSQDEEYRIAFANYILKPIFVGVIKQRVVVSISKEDIIEALEFKAS